MLKKKRTNSKGFTLIEIIAVLVLLGILAAVAVPRFIDLQSDARKQAVQGAVAAGSSNVTMVYAQALLQSGSAPTMASLADTLDNAQYTTVGDYTVSYADATTGITVTVTGPAGLIKDVDEVDRQKTITLQ